MFVQYGNFRHPPGTVEYSLRFDPILNAAEYPLATKAHFELKGKLISTTTATDIAGQQNIAAQISALLAAYVSGKDLLLVQDNGSISPVSILNSKTLGGVRVIKPPEFPVGDGTQYVTQLDYAIAIEAEIPFVGSAGALWSFRESLDFEGDGGAEIGAIRPLRGAVQIQTLHQFTEVVMVQKGEAVGYLSRWSGGIAGFQPPLFPAFQNHAPGATRFSKGEVRAIGRGKDRDYKLWPTSWYYTFISPVPIMANAEPALWPQNQ